MVRTSLFIPFVVLAMSLSAGTALSEDSHVALDTTVDDGSGSPASHIGSATFRPTQAVNLVLINSPEPIPARQVLLLVPAGCARLRDARAVVSPGSPDYIADNAGIVPLFLVKQDVTDGVVHATFNIGAALGGAPGSQAESLVSSIRLTLTPMHVGAQCEIQAFGI